MQNKTWISLSFVFLLLVGSFYVPATKASQPEGDQDFTIVNKTGVTIAALYVSPSKENDWEEDILGQDVLANGESCEISFSPKEKAALWDIRVEDSEGNALIWYNINLLEVSKVTLFYKNGKGTAQVE